MTQESGNSKKIADAKKGEVLNVPLIIFALILAFLIAILLVLTGAAKEGLEPTPKTEATALRVEPEEKTPTTEIADVFTAVYENEEGYALVPENFPTALFPGGYRGIESSSYYRNDNTKSSRYHYIFTRYGEVSNNEDIVKAVLNGGTYELEESDAEEGYFVAVAPRERLTYKVVELTDGAQKVEVVYEVSGY